MSLAKKISAVVLFSFIFASCQILPGQKTTNPSMKLTNSQLTLITPSPNITNTNKNMSTPSAETAEVTVVMKTTKGDITLELFPKAAPNTVANFVGLAGKSFYTGTIFHRVIVDFMIQGGDPNGNGTGGPGYKFADEFNNGYDFSAPYMLAMANSGPNTNGSQFFITVAPTTWLNNKHTIFGKVIKGQEVVDAIVASPTSVGDKPVTDIKIISIDIVEN